MKNIQEVFNEIASGFVPDVWAWDGYSSQELFVVSADELAEIVAEARNHEPKRYSEKTFEYQTEVVDDDGIAIVGESSWYYGPRTAINIYVTPDHWLAKYKTESWVDSDGNQAWHLVCQKGNFVNTAPHICSFRHPETGEEFAVGRSRWLVNATATEQVVDERNVITFVKTVFSPSPDGEKMIAEIRAEFGPDVIILGSIIAAQAYPGQVVAMTPAPGFERVPPDQKRMNPFKFTIFS